MNMTAEAGLLGDDVRCDPYAPGGGLPLFISPQTPELAQDIGAASAWVTAHRDAFDALLLDHGAVVLRGFPVVDTAAFAAMIDSYPAAALDYTAGATPRAAIADKVYEATRTPPDYAISLHQEMSYLPHYPARLAFYCHVPAETGGETVIADMRRFDAEMPAAIRDTVLARGVRYTRNFRDPGLCCGHPWLDLAHKPWTDAFGTSDADEAVAKAEAMGLSTRWLDDGALETSHVSRGFAEHPRTGRTIWFNQLTAQHMTPASLGPRAALWQEYYVDRGRQLPHQSTYGDGEEIPEAHRDILLALFDRLAVRFPWQHGDIMLLDNFLTAHGRSPYTGQRDVQVSLLD